MSTVTNKEEIAQQLADKVQETTAEFYGYFQPQWSARSDVLKTLVSLASGAIVLAVTFSKSLRELNASTYWRYVVVFSFAMFTVSLILGFLGLWIGVQLHELQSNVFNRHSELTRLLKTATTREEFNKKFEQILKEIMEPVARSDRVSNWLFWFSSGCFCLAITSLSIVGILQILF